MGRGSRAHPSCNAAAVFVLALATAVAFATPATAVDASIQQLVDAREVGRHPRGSRVDVCARAAALALHSQHRCCGA